MDYLQYASYNMTRESDYSFKPYYKWITFNILIMAGSAIAGWVLNLIINGLPSIFTIINAII